MKSAFRLFLTSLALFPGMALAQERQFTSEPSPPPLPHSAQNPLSPPPKPLPNRPGPARHRPGGNALSGLVGYLDSEMQAGPNDIEAPVTGYGNEALWDVGSAFDTPLVSDTPEVPPSTDAAGSTAGGPNR